MSRSQRRVPKSTFSVGSKRDKVVRNRLLRRCERQLVKQNEDDHEALDDPYVPSKDCILYPLYKWELVKDGKRPGETDRQFRLRQEKWKRK